MMTKKYEYLMSPIKIGSLTLKNRYAVGPMGSFYLIAGPKGEYNLNGTEYIVERARGGFGLITLGAIPTDMSADKPNIVDGMLPPLYAPGTFKHAAYLLTDRVHVYGAKIFVQLSMGHGRMREEKAPSRLPLFKDPTRMTQELTAEEIENKIEYIVRSARLMKECGFDGVEVHAMHWGYLLDQFGMALTNKRTDEYGGDLKGRLTVAKKIVEGIKSVCGADYPVSMRLGLKSYMKGFNQASLTGEDEAGRTLEEGVKVAQLLESFGYDMLNVNSGTYDSFYYCAPPQYMPKGYNLCLAKEAKKAVKIPIFTAGRMDDPDMCEQAIANGETDGIAIARASLVEPHYAKKVEMGCIEKIRPCISCQNCMRTIFSVGSPLCAVNPTAMKEDIYGFEKALQPKKVAVIGGGIAGMEAARTAALRGHYVELYEKSNVLGGNVIAAGVHDFKDSNKQLIEWYKRELDDLKIPVHFNTEVTADMVKNMGFGVAIFSIGSVPVMPKTIKGIDCAMSMTSIDALLGKKELGARVVIVGGGLTGTEMAYAFAKEGKKVTLIEALDKILSSGPPIPWQVAAMLNDLLDKYKENVNVLTGILLEEINNKGAVVSDKNGVRTELEADSVVFAIGFRPLPSMVNELIGAGIEVYEIGDGRAVANIGTAIHDAYEVTRRL